MKPFTRTLLVITSNHFPITASITITILRFVRVVGVAEFGVVFLLQIVGVGVGIEEAGGEAAGSISWLTSIVSSASSAISEAGGEVGGSEVAGSASGSGDSRRDWDASGLAASSSPASEAGVRSPFHSYIQPGIPPASWPLLRWALSAMISRSALSILPSRLSRSSSSS